MSEENYFQSPLASRYASQEMLDLFKPLHRYAIWRKLWIALARAQKNLGLPIKAEQIAAMEKKIHDIDFRRAAYYEKQLSHDVMAHIYAFIDVCPEAKGVIHLGATSCYITDNADLLIMKEALEIIKAKMLATIQNLSALAEKYIDLPTLSYTHMQTSLPTTVGKRICMWLQDLLMDFHDLIDRIEQLHFLGAKGTSGTQASFLALLDQSPTKVRQMEVMIAKEMGFNKLLSIAGQTYTRKQDVRVLSALGSIAISAHKLATDIRLLAHLKEIEEPFKKDTGSVYLQYKRNPSHTERICGLSRFLISLVENPVYTAATQWLERTLDDSSSRRLCIPEAFLCADSILNLLQFVTKDLVVYPKIIEHNLKKELPFLALESILQKCIERGREKQPIQEALKKHLQKITKKWKEEGIEEDLIDSIAKDPLFDLSYGELLDLLDPKKFIGRAPEQVREFLSQEVEPMLRRYQQVPAYRLDIQI